jgi:hypothetical protein
VQQQPGYGPPGGGGYGAAPPGGGQAGFGGAAGGASYQVLTLDVGCGGTLDHAKIAELANQMAAQGFTLVQVFVDIRAAFGPFCPKRCGVLVFKRG